MPRRSPRAASRTRRSAAQGDRAPPLFFLVADCEVGTGPEGVARRANARSKILVVDGLERVDPEQYARFVELATAGGYQLIGSRVDRGEVVLEAVTADDFA